MADTVRTRAAVLAALIDPIGGGKGGSACTTRDIDPQDLRDAVVSMFGVYGSITVADGSTAQTGVTTTPEKLTAFTANGPAVGVTADHTNDRLTIGTNGAGVYLVVAQFSFEGGAVATTWQLHIRVDQVESALGVHRRTASTDVGSCSVVGLLTLADADQVEVYIESDSGAGRDITVVDGQLALVRVA